MSMNFDLSVSVEPKQTVVLFTKLNYHVALCLLTLCARRLHWSGKETFVLSFEGRPLNQDTTIRVTIPYSVNKHPFTEEYIRGFFNGIREAMKNKTTADFMAEAAKLYE